MSLYTLILITRLIGGTKEYIDIMLYVLYILAFVLGFILGYLFGSEKW